MTRKAFTLIELLVVISIIALLLSILMPALNMAKMRAYGVVCMHNVRTLWYGWIMYADEHNGKIVGGHTGSNEWVDTPPSAYSIRAEKEAIKKGLLFPYLRDVDVYRCPADTRSKTRNNGFRSYSITGGMNGEWELGYHKLDQVRPPDKYYAFVEENDPRGFNMGSWLIEKDAHNWVDPVATWHVKSSTLGFVDGRVEIHRWLDKSTIEAATIGLFYAWPYSTDSGEDLKFMQQHYAQKP